MKRKEKYKKKGKNRKGKRKGNEKRIEKEKEQKRANVLTLKNITRVYKQNLKQQRINGLRGATVARLTPDQKVACSNHVGVIHHCCLNWFFFNFLFF